jgi:hypothetical protein
MGIGTSIFLFVLGAILAFAVHLPVDGVNVHALGFILMFVGILGGVLSAVFWNSWGGWGGSRPRGWASDGYGDPRDRVYRRERYVVDRRAPVVESVPVAPVVEPAVPVARPGVPVANVPVAGVPVAGEAVPVAPVVGQGVPVAGAGVPVVPVAPRERRVRRTVYEDRY